MSVEIFGAPVWHESISGPGNDDDIDGESVSDGLTLAQDNAQFLKSKTKLLGSWGHVNIPTIDEGGGLITRPFEKADTAPALGFDYAWPVSALVSAHIESVVPYGGAAGYYARIYLVDTTETHTYSGPVMKVFDGAPATVTAFFPEIEPGEYNLFLRLEPLDTVSREGADHGVVINVVTDRV